ncbi:MAG: PQQ-dependent sugar dehydrogenase [Hyphomonadaceae bacterium]
MRYQNILVGISALALFACGGPSSSEAPAAADNESSLGLTSIVEGLEFPWSLAVLPNGDMLVTEREGRLNLLKDGVLTPISGTPEAYVERQGGYFGLVLDPDFATNRLIYMAYAKGTDDANSTAVMKATLSADGTAITDVSTIYQADLRDTAFHFGGRLQFMNDGTLLVSLGDGFRYMDDAQTPNNTHGTIVRINADGTIPDDNPFIGVEGAKPEVYSHGHRNVQGLFVDPATGTVFAHEHGPKGGDELNIITAGLNYGWPVITYGVNYDGTIISKKSEEDGLEQPYVKWVPSIAPSGLTLYTGDKYEGWTGDLVLGAMNGPVGQKLVRVDLEDGQIGDTHIHLADIERPIRDVVQGQDGYLYIITNELDGSIFRIDPN